VPSTSVVSLIFDTTTIQLIRITLASKTAVSSNKHEDDGSDIR
jgi:hypothetical protein